MNKGNFVILRGQKHGNLYSMTESSVQKYYVATTLMPDVEIWN